MWRNKRVFVSGGGGVIGTVLVMRLHDLGAKVYVGDLKPRPPHWPADIEYRRGDLNHITRGELDAYAPEFFFHLAATFERSTESYDFWEENYLHNLRLSHHLMTGFKNNKALKKVIFASSYLIYNTDLYIFNQPQHEGVRIKESDPIYPRNLCGAAKLLHEIELAFLHQYNCCQTVCARIFRSYGRDSRDIISRWVRSLLRNEKITVYNTAGKFDFIYADDVAEGLLRLAACDANGVYNLGRGEARSIAEIIDILKIHFPEMRMAYARDQYNYEASQADMALYKSVVGWVPTTRLEQAIPEIIAYEKGRSTKEEQATSKNVLITSISKKVPLVNGVKNACLKLGENNKVIGADACNDIVGKYFADDFWLMPRLDALNIKDFIAYCRNKAITCVIPTRDGELPFFAENRGELARHGISVMISGPDCVYTCLDKLLFFKKVSSFGLPAIKTTEDINDLPDGTFVVKERFGAGARKIGLNLTRKQAVGHAAGLDNPVFQPFVSGKEASVDVYVDKSGRAKGAVARTRDLVISGESQITTTFRNEDLERLSMSLAEGLGIYGHAVLQVIIDHNNGLNVIECNDRFGGASTLGIAAGLDSFYWFLLECAGDKLDRYPFCRAPHEKRQIRFADDLLV